MNLSRIHRLLNLIGLLQAGREHSVDAIARACKVHRRTVFRDLDTLREAGVPLEFDVAKQRYAIPGIYYLPPTNFTPEEALTLIVLCHEMGDRSRLPFFEPVVSACLKLESALPGNLREQVRRVAGSMEIQPAPRSRLEGKAPVYRQLLEAVGRRQCVRIRYGSLTEWETICTRVEIYRLLFSRRSWYAIGRSSLHRSVRTFNVGRIEECEILADGYQIPANFSVDRYLRNAWHMIPEPGPDQEVLVRFQPMVAQNVAEILWHKTQRTSILPDGSLEFAATVSGLKEISWWILGYGDQAEVIRPEPLRQIIGRHAAKLHERYNERMKDEG
jgi:proteasome accessory factor B